MHADPTPTDTQATRAAGLILGGATLAAIVLMAFHPSAGPHGEAAMIADIAAKSLRDQLVHGGMMLCVAGFAIGVTSFALRLGARRTPVLAGLMLYLAGCVAVCGAAVFDGFVLSDLATRYAAGPATDVHIGYSLILLCATFVQHLARIGLLAMSAGILALSLDLLRQAPPLRRIAWIGIIAGGAPALDLAGVNPALHAHLVLGIVAVQAVWTIAVSRWLMKA